MKLLSKLLRRSKKSNNASDNNFDKDSGKFAIYPPKNLNSNVKSDDTSNGNENNKSEKKEAKNIISLMKDDPFEKEVEAQFSQPHGTSSLQKSDVPTPKENTPNHFTDAQNSIIEQKETNTNSLPPKNERPKLNPIITNLNRNNHASAMKVIDTKDSTLARKKTTNKNSTTSKLKGILKRKPNSPFVPQSTSDIKVDYLNKILNLEDEIVDFKIESMEERPFTLVDKWFRIYPNYKSREGSQKKEAEEKETWNNFPIESRQTKYVQSSLTKPIVPPTPIVRRKVQDTESIERPSQIPEVDIERPPSFLIKISAWDSRKIPDAQLVVGVFRKECLTYAHLSAEGIDKTCTIPYVYYAHFDSHHRYIVIIEDCFRYCDYISSSGLLDYKQALSIIRQLAIFQVQFWHYVPLDSYGMEGYKWKGIYHGNDDIYMKEINCKWIPESFSVLYHSRLFPRINGSTTQHYSVYWARYSKKNASNLVYHFMRQWKLLVDWSENLKGSKLSHERRLVRLIALMKEHPIKDSFEIALKDIVSLKLPRTIIHGGLCVQNILLHRFSGKLFLLDWYYVSVGNGLIDLIDLLVHCFGNSTLQKYSDEYLRIYHDILNENGFGLAPSEYRSLLLSALWYVCVIAFGYTEYLQSVRRSVEDVSKVKEYKEGIRPLTNILFLLDKYAFGEVLGSESEQPKSKRFLF